jgi:hypothetical protein
MPYADKIKLPVLHVPMAREFISAWRGGRFSGEPRSVAEYFRQAFGLGYIDRKPERQTNGLYVLRFNERNLVVPVHANGSLKQWEMEAHGFYHERRLFQLGRKNMNPAAMDGNAIRPGLVAVDWKTMY